MTELEAVVGMLLLSNKWKYWNGYCVSRDGSIIGCRGRKVKGTFTSRGYRQTTGPNRKKLLIHRIVAYAWCDGACDKKEVNHIDGNKLNNHANNLEWLTSEEHRKKDALRRAYS